MTTWVSIYGAPKKGIFADNGVNVLLKELDKNFKADKKEQSYIILKKIDKFK